MPDLAVNDASFENPTRYLNELIKEMKALNQLNCDLKCTQKLLSAELARVWTVFQQTSIGQSRVIEKTMNEVLNAASPVGSLASFSIPAIATPRTPKTANNVTTSSNRKSPQKKTPLDSGKRRHREGDGGKIVLEMKVFIPQPPVDVEGSPVKCNYIGRILGPGGLTAKNLENMLDVMIFIRGKGSVRDAAREAELKNRKGWEHLKEDLHVLLVARDSNYKKCEEKLNLAANKVESMMTPAHDELKKEQLIQLAIMNGTYCERTTSP